MAATRPRVETRYLVRFREDPEVFHEGRVLVEEGLAVGDAIILTPDCDIYHMTLRASPLAEIHAVGGSSGNVRLPQGVRRGGVYLFEDARGDPSPNRLKKYTGEAAALAEQWLDDHSAPPPAGATPVRRGTGKSMADPDLGPPAAVVPATTNPAGSDGMVWVVAEYGRVAPLGTIISPGIPLTTIGG